MDTVVVIGRLFLAATLVVAAVAKLVDPPAFRRAVHDLGVPERWSRLVSRTVPGVELALAVGLLATPVAPLAAAGSLLLLAAFTALLSWNLSKGRRPACNCFGSATAEPIGWRSVVRNGVLLILAAVAVTPGAPGLPEWLTEHTSASSLQTVAGALLGAVVIVGAAGFAMGRTLHGSTVVAAPQVRHRDPVPVGASVSHLGVRSRFGPEISPELPVLVVRTDPGCGPCHALLPRLILWQEAYAGLLEIAVLTGAAAHGHEGYGQLRHLLTDGEALAGDLRLDVTPSAVVVTADDQIGSAVGEGAIEIGALVNEAVSGQELATLGVGDPAVGVVLAGARGVVSLADHVGSITLLVFWDPFCSFCQGMLVDLLQWERSIEGSNRHLLVAGQGTFDTVRAQGFRSSAVDPDGSVMRIFGGYGTPSAVLIDAAGRVASEVAHGGDEVRALIERANLLGGLAAPAITAP